jgi:hypothetical protein
VLADHRQRVRRRRSSVVVRDVLTRRNQEVAYARRDLRVDLPEPPRGYRFVPRGDPGAVGLGVSPAPDQRVAVARAQFRLEMQLQAARLPRHEPHTFDQFRRAVDEQVRTQRDVDDSVVRTQHHPIRGSQQARESTHFRIHLFEPRGPLRRLPADGVSNHVELWHIQVEQPGRPRLAQPPRSRFESIGDGCRDPVLGSTEHRTGESTRLEPRGPNNDGRQPDGGRSLEQGWQALPGLRVEAVVPAAQLVDESVVGTIQCGVANQPVFPRKRAGGQRRERRRGRGREDRIDGLSGCRGERARVTRAGAESGGAQTVDEDHDDAIGVPKSEPIPLRSHAAEATRQNVGKADPVDSGPR